MTAASETDSAAIHHRLTATPPTKSPLLRTTTTTTTIHTRPSPPISLPAHRHVPSLFLEQESKDVDQQVSNASLSDNWRTINIDALDPDSSTNFDSSTLHPSLAPVSESEIRSIGQQVRQLLRGGDAEGALRGALESAPYGGDDGVKEIHLATVVEVLQGIRASEISGMLGRIWGSEGGSEVVDCLMKYL